MRRRKLGIAAALGGVAILGGVISRLFFSSPSDYKDIRVEPIPQIQTTTQETLPSPIPELKFDVLSLNLGKMLLEEEDIPRNINNKVLSYGSHIQSGYLTQCEYPQLKKDFQVPRMLPISFGQSAKYCTNIFTIDLQDINEIIIGVAVYNSIDDAKEAFSSYKSVMINAPEIRELVVKTRKIGDDIFAFADLRPGKKNGYMTIFRNNRFIGYVLASEQPTKPYLDLNSVLQMAETLNSRITH